LDEPIYSEPEQSVKLVLKNNIVMRNMRQTDRVVETIGSDMWLGLDDLEKSILSYMSATKCVTTNELVEHIGKSKRTVGTRLNHLIALKIIKRNGAKNDPTQTYEMV